MLLALGTDRGGLSAEEARRRLAAAGPNLLPRERPDPPLRVMLRQVDNPLLWVLIASGTVAILLGRPTDGAVVLGVVLANALVGFVQELRASRAIAALAAMVPETASVVRDARRTDVPQAELVPGDVVLLAAGQRVPADVRLLGTRELRVDESALTGESVPVLKATAPVPPTTPLAERGGMAYAGTLVTRGTATAAVVSTAAGTELGRIATLVSRVPPPQTPLTRAMARVAAWLALAISLVGVVLLLAGILRGYALADAVIAAITLAVGAIPEGLPAVITIALAIGVQRMARRQAVVRRLPAAETLGSTTVICTDKTGTLTRNEMTVRELWTPAGATYRLSGVGYAPEGRLVRESHELARAPEEVAALTRAAVLCSDADVTAAGGGWQVHGDPTEAALVVAHRKLGHDPADDRVRHPRRDALPFDAVRQMMATLHPGWVIVKGAPEAVLARCREGDGEATAAVERMASRGMRVLAVAARPHAGARLDDADLARDLRLCGLVGMIDPPRPEAVAAVATCRAAGIGVKMITGDHPATAEAIGREIGLLAPGQRVLTGTDLAGLDDHDLATAAREVTVFARVAPEHKLALVRSLQVHGEVVAMTGDGVNDAPALRQADIGVAMGLTGTAASREAAEIVLADDNFASIAAAVEEGRRVFDNLVKALAFVLPTNLGFALIVLASVLFFPIEGGTPQPPMEPVQLLWINLVATVALALPLAFEAAEPDVMTRPPRRPGAPILSRFVLMRTALVAALMTGAALLVFALARPAGDVSTADLSEAQTAAVTAVIVFQMIYLLTCRSLRWSVREIGLWSNPTVYLGIAGLAVVHAGFVYLPFMNDVFDSRPPAPAALGLAALVALAVVPLVAVEKRARRRAGGPAAAG